jgi:hypothetical protein
MEMKSLIRHSSLCVLLLFEKKRLAIMHGMIDIECVQASRYMYIPNLP